MEQGNATLLVVDDDSVNLEIIEEDLQDDGYHIVTASDGEQAWALLQEDPNRFDAVLLDRMMPRMDGLAVLACMKDNPVLTLIPVIMQTAAAGTVQMQVGLNAGAYYYLSKPFDKETLRAIVRAAIRDYTQYCATRTEAKTISGAVKLLNAGRFSFRTPKEARSLAALLSGTFPDPEKVGVGIFELLLNAVEHGNLGLTYKDKSRLLATDSWEEELARRLALPQYAACYATVEFDRGPGTIRVVVKDQGEGFDWRPYLEFSPERAYDTHGRGIAIARQGCFDRLEYLGNGNEVAAIVELPAISAADSISRSNPVLGQRLPLPSCVIRPQ